MGNAHRQANQIAGLGGGGLTIQEKIKLPFQHADEFILIRVDMRRHEGAGREKRVESETAFAMRYGFVSLPKDGSDHSTLTRAGWGHTCCHAHFLKLLVSDMQISIADFGRGGECRAIALPDHAAFFDHHMPIGQAHHRG